MKMERTVEGPGGGEMDVKKTTDFDTGTRTTERKTSAGGSSDVTRQRQAGGGYYDVRLDRNRGRQVRDDFGRAPRRRGIDDDHGRGRASAGRSSRERIDGGGRETRGRFHGPGRPKRQTDTVRQGDRSVTKAEGSGGGSAISSSGGLGDRTTIAQSGSGDVYAGHDGNVYRKTDDGWQQHQRWRLVRRRRAGPAGRRRARR